MDNPETLATLYTQDTGRRQCEKNIIQRNTENQTNEQHGPNKKTVVYSGAHEGQDVPASYKTPVVLLIYKPLC